MAAPAGKPNRAAPAERLRQHRETATECAGQIGQDDELNERDRSAIALVFRRKLLPPGQRGRRNSAAITAAYADWKRDVRGVELYERPGAMPRAF